MHLLDRCDEVERSESVSPHRANLSPPPGIKTVDSGHVRALASEQIPTASVTGLWLAS